MQQSPNLNISVFGLGYVGCVSMGCLAMSGHNVIGIDSNEAKVSQVKQGLPTIFEPDLDQLMMDGHKAGRITATTDVEFAVKNSTISMVTVGTPSTPAGELDLSYIFRVAESIGRALRNINRHHTIAIRSTVKPGTCNEVARILAHHSEKKANVDFSVVANPEFLREGSAIKDYLTPPYVLIGSDDERGAKDVSAIYAGIKGDTICVRTNTAEIIKYVNNSWHALKVAFGNEVGAVCKTLNIDSQEVMDLFVRDRSLNISANYLRPGFAFGGSCLPKDLSGFTTLAQKSAVEVPLLSSVKDSNEEHIQRAINLIKAQGHKKISFVGLTFKEGTDDIRNSPSLQVIQTLNREGYNIRVLDNDVSTALKNERNIATMKSLLGDVIHQLVQSPKELLDHSQVVVLAKNNATAKQIISETSHLKLIDLVYMGRDLKRTHDYVGLAW